MKRQALIDLAAAGTVLPDGATGSNLRAAGMPVGVPPELWVLEHPQVLESSYLLLRGQIL